MVMREFNFSISDARHISPNKVQETEGSDKVKTEVLSWFSYLPLKDEEKKDHNILNDPIEIDRCIHELYFDPHNQQIWIVRPALPYHFAVVNLQNKTNTLIDNFIGEEGDEVIKLDEDLIQFLNAVTQAFSR